MWSASFTEETRWETIRTVLPFRIVRSALQDPLLGMRIDGAQRVVEDQDERVAHERARDGGALLLAARERDAALADDRLQPLRKRGDVAGESGQVRGLVDLLVRRASARPKRMFSAIDSEKRNVSCGTMPIHSRSWRSGMVSIGRPSMKIVPGGGSNVRVMQRQQRRLAAAGAADDADRSRRGARAGRCRAAPAARRRRRT